MSMPATTGNPVRLGRALGWVSVALGAAALLAPDKVSRAVGAPGATNVVRAVGAREMASAAGLLLRPGKPGWVWSRVAGDAMDLALLGLALRSPAAHRKRLAYAALAIAGIAALDAWAGWQSQQSTAMEEGEPI